MNEFIFCFWTELLRLISSNCPKTISVSLAPTSSYSPILILKKRKQSLFTDGFWMMPGKNVYIRQISSIYRYRNKKIQQIPLKISYGARQYAKFETDIYFM